METCNDMFKSEVNNIKWKKVQKALDCIIPTKLHSRKGKSRPVVARGWGWVIRIAVNGSEGTFWGDGDVFSLGCGDSYMTIHLLKLVELYIQKSNFTVCKLYPNKM